MAALNYERSAGSAQRRGKWLPAPEDTATVVLAYRPDAETPAIMLPAVRDTTRFVRMILSAVTEARDASAQHRPQLDTLPLRLVSASADAPTTLSLHFGAEPGPADGVSRFSLIEEGVAPLAAYQAPAYPPSAQAMGLDGEVDVTFIVRPDGSADMNTVFVQKATNAEFRDAVLRHLSTLRFRPSRVDCRAAYQIVDQPFYFHMSKKS